MIQIKNAKELDGMRRANALSAAALKYGGQHIEAGMTTWELDKLQRSMASTATMPAPMRWARSTWKHSACWM